MAIPPEHRTSGQLLGKMMTQRDIENNIVQLLSNAELGCMPLKRITQRFIYQARALGLDLNEILKSMERDGRIAVKYFDTISRTFVFSEAQWGLVHQMMQDDPSWSFDKYAEGLRNYK